MTVRRTTFAALLVIAGCVKSPAPNVLLQEADAAYAAKDYGRAAWIYCRLKQRFADTPNICLSLGYSYLALGWTRHAGGEFSRAVTLSGRTNALAWIGLGTYYAKTNDWKLAVLCFSHARTYDPANPLVYRKLGNAFFYSKEYAQAAENYQHAAALSDRKDDLYAALGLCYERSAQWPKAVGTYEQSFQLNQKNDRVVHRLAVLYRDRFNNVPKARHYYEVLEKLNPLVAKAEADSFQHKFSTALVSNPLLLAAAQVKPTNIVVETLPSAVSTQMSSASPQAYGNQADYYEALAKRSFSNDLPKEALEYYKKALEVDPRRGRYNRDIAQLYETSFSDINLAIKHYDRFLQTCKDDSEFQAAVAHVKQLRDQYNRIEVDERGRRQVEEEKKRKEEDERKLAEAEQRRKAFEVAAQQPQTYDDVIEAGARCLQQGTLEDARRFFQKAVSINDSYPNAYYNLGLIYVMQTNFETGIQYFTTALKKDPKFADSHLALGTVYDRMKRTSDAIEHFNMYLELAPNTQYADSVRTWLTQHAGAR